jgi:hypothetical protein
MPRKRWSGRLGSGIALAALLIPQSPLLAQKGSWLPPANSSLVNVLSEGWKNSDKAVKLATEAGVKGAELLDKVDPMTGDDKKYDPEPDPAGQPKLPSLCQGDPHCNQCFAKPYTDLESVRIRFEKLRRVGQSTKKMITDAVAFGDGASSIHGIAALAWAKEKQKIRASEKNFDANYDAKYHELLGTLESALHGVASCEESVFGTVAWYDRFGFIFYQYMADRYQAPG